MQSGSLDSLSTGVFILFFHHHVFLKITVQIPELYILYFVPEPFQFIPNIVLF